MAFDIEEKELKCLLRPVVEKIFASKEFKNLSDFQRRQAVFDYLVHNTEYDFDLLNDIYSGKNREYADEIVSIFLPEKKKGICNSFSYGYKTILDLLNIPCMLVACSVLEDSIDNLRAEGVNTNTTMIKRDKSGKYLIPHMLTLVENIDGTFSFDDITYAIFNKNNEKDYFNYDMQLANKYNQLNFEGIDTYMLRAIINNSQDTPHDLRIRTQYGLTEEQGFLKIPFEKIKRYDKSNIEKNVHENAERNLL